ncbi:MAG: peptidoglycan-binding protein [Chloroflexi bacterium]|nr:peptidoglycan-binding protein [Chloroflexota bacterium]
MQQFESTWLAALARNSSPDTLIALTLSALAFGPASADTWLERLADQLERIQPVAARLGYLADLVLAPRLTSHPASERFAGLRSVAREMALSNIQRPTGDAAATLLRAAELERVLGDSRMAESLLNRLIIEVDETADAFVLLEALAAASRPGALSRSRLDADRLQRMRAALARFPFSEARLLLLQAQHGSPDDRAAWRTLLDETDRVLARFVGKPTSLHADVLDSRATLEWQTGNREAALSAGRRSQEVRASLGWKAGAGPDSDSYRAQPHLALALDLVAEESIVVSSVSPDRGGQLRIRSVNDSGTVADVLWSDRKPGEALAEEASASLVTRLVTDWGTLGVELGSLLLGPDWLHLPPSVDIGLQVNHRRLAPVPWELMRSPGADLIATLPAVSSLFREAGEAVSRSSESRLLQVILNALTGSQLSVDGVMGPESRAALTEFQRARALDPTGSVDAATTSKLRSGIVDLASKPPYAIVAQPSYQRQFLGSRGTQAQGSDLYYMYSSWGFMVDVVEDPTPTRLAEALQSRSLGQPSIVHLAAGISASTGTLALEFGEVSPQSTSDTGEVLTTNFLSRILESTSRSPAGPVVILDVPRPSTETEAARMLLLRNLFAADLFQFGNALAVVGIGLAMHQASSALQAMLGTLRSGRSLADAVRAIRALGQWAPGRGYGFPEECAFASAALFTCAPWMGVVQP